MITRGYIERGFVFHVYDVRAIFVSPRVSNPAEYIYGTSFSGGATIGAKTQRLELKSKLNRANTADGYILYEKRVHDTKASTRKLYIVDNKYLKGKQLEGILIRYKKPNDG